MYARPEIVRMSKETLHMTGLNKFPMLLVLAMSLAGMGCGDDKKEDTSGDGDTGDGDATKPDAGGDGDAMGDGGVDLSVSCMKGSTFEGHTAADIKAKVAAEGACITDEQIQEVCETGPNVQAGVAGGYCFRTAGKRGEELRTCAIEGIDEVQGVGDTSPGLTDACLHCYADSVGCTAESKCAIPCAVDALSQDCADCRIEVGCTPTFYTCTGLPTADDLK
jgi:hypothetical protein